MKPGSIIHARSIYGPRMADRQPVCTILAHVAHGFCRCMLALQNCYLRLALVLWLAQALGHTWTVESTAKLHEHPRWKVFAVPTKMFRVRFWVGSWGGVSPKKTQDPVQLPGDCGLRPSTTSPPGEDAHEESYRCLQEREGAHGVTWSQHGLSYCSAP